MHFALRGLQVGNIIGGLGGVDTGFQVRLGGGGGGVVKFYPAKKKGGGAFCSHANGGTTSFWVVLTRELQVLDILKGWGAKKKASTLYKWGHKKIYPVLRRGGGGHKQIWTRNFPILKNETITNPTC